MRFRWISCEKMGVRDETNVIAADFSECVLMKISNVKVAKGWVGVSNGIVLRSA